MDIEESPSPNNPPSPDYDPNYPTFTRTVLNKKLAPEIQEIAKYYYSDDEDKIKNGRFYRPKISYKFNIICTKKPIEREVSDSTTLEKRSRDDDRNNNDTKKLKPGQGPRPPGLDGGAGVELEDNSDFTLFDLLGRW